MNARYYTYMNEVTQHTFTEDRKANPGVLFDPYGIEDDIVLGDLLERAISEGIFKLVWSTDENGNYVD